MKKMLGFFVGLLMIFGLVGNASAALIDFTDSTTWSGADGQSSFSNTVSGIDVTLDAYKQNIFGNWQTGVLTWQDDGLGVDNCFLGEDDEIDSWEKIKVSFNPDQIVNSISFYDVESTETVRYNFEGGAWVYASGSTGVEDLFTVTTGSTDEWSWIEVSAYCWDNAALAQINVGTVPVPSAIFLLSSGLIALAGVSRKKQK